MGTIDLKSIDSVETGIRIKKYMKLYNISVKNLQEICGCSHQTVYKWLKGKTIPKIDHLIILSSLFQVSINEIVVTKQIV